MWVYHLAADGRDADDFTAVIQLSSGTGVRLEFEGPVHSLIKPMRKVREES